MQETLIRAWRSHGDFEGRASLRTWLYRIAPNACLRALENRSRRPLPSGLGSPAEDPEKPLAAAQADIPWLQPIPRVAARATPYYPGHGLRWMLAGWDCASPGRPKAAPLTR